MENKALVNFYKKYNNRRLADAGSTVSKEYRLYQNAYVRMMKSVAAEIGGEVVKVSKGHYYESLFIERDGKFIYVWHEKSDRTYINCDDLAFLYYRKAKTANDYKGGFNYLSSLRALPDKLNKLFEEYDLKA